MYLGSNPQEPAPLPAHPRAPARYTNKCNISHKQKMLRTCSALPDVGHGMHLERRRAEVVRPGAAAVGLPLVHEELGEIVVEGTCAQTGVWNARRLEVLLSAAYVGCAG